MSARRFALLVVVTAVAGGCRIDIPPELLRARDSGPAPELDGGPADGGAALDGGVPTDAALPPGDGGGGGFDAGPPPDGAVAYYRFDGRIVVGRNALPGPDLEAVRRPHQVEGRVGCGVELEGEALTLPNAGALPTQQVRTIMLWAKTDGGSAAGEQTLLQLRSAAADADVRLVLDQTTLRVVRTVSVGGADSVTFVDAPSPWTAPQWHHIAIVLDEGDVRLVIGGAPAGATLALPDVESFFSSDTELSLGDSRDDDSPFSGQLDELALFGPALSAAEIASLLTLEAPRCDDVDAALAERWTFDGPSPGATAVTGGVDLSAGTNAERTAGRSGCALDATSVTSHVFKDAADAPELAGLDVGSFAAWISLPPASSARRTIFAAKKEDGCGDVFGVGLQDELLRMWGSVEDSCAVENHYVASGNVVTPLEQDWAHVAYVADPAFGPTLYINGQRASPGTSSANPRAVFMAYTQRTVADDRVDLVVGQSPNQTESFGAAIDDVRLFDRPLSALEVATLAAEPAEQATCEHATDLDAGVPDAGPPGPGTVDGAFTADLATALGDADEIVDLALGPDAGVYVLANGGVAGAVLGKLRPDGSVDPSFGLDAGPIAVGSSGAKGQSLAYVPDGTGGGVLLVSTEEDGGLTHGVVRSFDLTGALTNWFYDGTPLAVVTPGVAEGCGTCMEIRTPGAIGVRGEGDAAVIAIAVHGPDGGTPLANVAFYSGAGLAGDVERVGADVHINAVTPVSASLAHAVGYTGDENSRAAHRWDVNVDGTVSPASRSALSAGTGIVGSANTSTSWGWTDSGGAWLNPSASGWIDQGPADPNLIETTQIATAGGFVYGAGAVQVEQDDPLVAFVFAAAQPYSPVSGFGDGSLGTGFALVPGLSTATAIAANDDGVYVAGCDDACASPALIRLRPAAEP